MHTYEGGIHVPGFVVWDKNIVPDTIDTPVHIVDWFPTIKEIVGDTTAQSIDFDGIDLTNLVLESEIPPTRDIYWLWGNYRRWALQFGDWKIVKYSSVPPQDASEWELYNYKTDIEESDDVSDQYPNIVQDLHNRYLQHRTKDWDY